MKSKVWFFYTHFSNSLVRGARHMEALRAKVILWAAAELPCVGRPQLSAPMVGKWRQRFLQHRTIGLTELPRSGAPRCISDDQVQVVITATLETKPEQATH